MTYELIAAVDLGSNSFRLQVGRVVDEQIYPLDSLKEPVRLASGLDEKYVLDRISRERGVTALRRFGERLRGFAPGAVRAVATNTLRVARNADDFLAEAEKALGFSIEVIAGREEARLIYSGAVHSLPTVGHKRLIVDIGGGSTEFIIGQRFEPLLMESLFMGCVSYSLEFFPGGKVDKKNFRAAEMAAAKEIQAILKDYRHLGWREAVGSSGSARTIAEVLQSNGLNPGKKTGITRDGLEKLKNLLIRAGSADDLQLQGLRPDRLPVFPGAVAIMCAIFSELDLAQMNYADGALRLGVLYDLLGRFHHQDTRDATIREFMRRYQVEAVQAERVEALAVHLFKQLGGAGGGHEHHLSFLTWAARVHEIGVSISHASYHKHGAYILTYADMPGFSKQDQLRLAQLVLAHRGKLENKLEKLIAGLPQAAEPNWDKVICLRLAVLFNRSRDADHLPPCRLSAREQGFELRVPEGWLQENPLTAVALDEEVLAWRKMGKELRLRESPL